MSDMPRAVPITQILPIKIRTVTEHSITGLGSAACPLCKTAIPDDELTAISQAKESEGALEITLIGHCPQCRNRSTTLMRFVATKRRIDRYVWSARHGDWDLVGWTNNPTPSAGVFHIFDALCMAIPCMVFAVIPSIYQSTPNFIGLFLMSYLASRIARWFWSKP